MLTLLVSFLLTLVVILFTWWGFSRMGVPSYRPSRSKVEELLQGLIDGYTSREEWELFIGMPIQHDPELEAIRVRCVALEEGDDQHPPYPHGINGYLYNRAGREAAKLILQEVKTLKANEPYGRDF
ncbi:hypothetical protein [Balneatrix alpica]|uniref:hypothetical protein n=1 Tax=Balneatrix alpica TaxID=75684 RepID=UPI0027393307|nr:hypothetical protein [Balneatrix alpica]